MDLLLGLVRAGATNLIVVTHDNNLAQRGDRTLRIVDGPIELEYHATLPIFLRNLFCLEAKKSARLREKRLFIDIAFL